MANDQILDNAMAAAASPADGPPAPFDPAQRAAEAAAKETARVAALTPTERRQEQITKDPKYLAGDPTLVAEMRALVTSQTTPDEAKAWAEAPLERQREVYGLEHPRLLASYDPVEYTEQFGWAESELLTMSRNWGLDRETVHRLRDAGVELGLQVTDAPLPDDVVTEKFDKIPGLTPGQRTRFVALFRQVEGGAS